MSEAPLSSLVEERKHKLFDGEGNLITRKRPDVDGTPRKFEINFLSNDHLLTIYNDCDEST